MDESTLFTSMTSLSKEFGEATVRSLEDASLLCHITNGDNLAIVKYGSEEFCVRDTKCECVTFIKLGICPHLMAVLRDSGFIAIQRFISRLKPPSASKRLTNSQAGRKPNQTIRKGSRSVRKTPQATHSINNKSEYLLVRINNRIKVCNGCKLSLNTERFVIRHRCAIPYFKDKAWNTPSQAGNHYFHPNLQCVVSSPQHTSFDGFTAIEPTIKYISAIKKIMQQGNLSEAP